MFVVQSYNITCVNNKTNKKCQLVSTAIMDEEIINYLKLAHSFDLMLI